MRKFFLVFLLFNTLVQAQTDDLLYEGRVPIEKYHDINAQENFRRAFTQVLIQLSGDANTPRQPMIQERLGNLDRLVENYTYQVLPEKGQRVFVVHFDKAKTNEMLLQLGLPHWPAYVSPPLLGWIEVEGEFLTEPTQQEVELLKTQALQRGVTLVLPIFDIDDLAVLKPSDRNVKIKAAVAKIVQRYRIPSVLVGWVFKTAGSWQSQWHLYIEEKEVTFHVVHPQRSLLITEAMNRTLDEMANYFSKTPSMMVSPSEEFDFLVVDLPSLPEYVRVRDYLKKLPIVTEIQILSVQRKQAKFRVSVEGGKEAFLQAVSLGNVLVLQKEQDLIFRFNKEGQALTP